MQVSNGEDQVGNIESADVTGLSGENEDSMPVPPSNHEAARFSFSESSQVCVDELDIHPDLEPLAPQFAGVSMTKVYEALGQRDYAEGIGRRGGELGAYCTDDGRNQILTWSLQPNRNGEPYVLSLDLRQGVAIWTRTIERTPDELNPERDFASTPHGERLPKSVEVMGSISADKRILQDQLIEHLLKEVVE